MENRLSYFVFSSPYEQEEFCRSCFIVLQVNHKELLSFCEYVDINTQLWVDGFTKHELFYTSFGEFKNCYVVEVHLDDSPYNQLSCEEKADLAANGFLQMLKHSKE